MDVKGEGVKIVLFFQQQRWQGKEKEREGRKGKRREGKGTVLPALEKSVS